MNFSGNHIDFFLAFLGGVTLSFTPCVYPLLPITVGVVASEAIVSRTKGFVLSLTFVSGLAVTYATLGMIAAFTGRYFGKISSNPVFDFLVGGIIILFALSLLEVLKLPFLALSVKTNHKKGCFIYTFIIGLASGFAVSPCIIPVLGSILAYVSSRQNILYGSMLLLSFAYGMGLLLLLAGTFSGLLASLPKPGIWMVRVKKLMGIILLGWGVYFIFSGIRRF